MKRIWSLVSVLGVAVAGCATSHEARNEGADGGLNRSIAQNVEYEFNTARTIAKRVCGQPPGSSVNTGQVKVSLTASGVKVRRWVEEVQNYACEGTESDHKQDSHWHRLYNEKGNKADMVRNMMEGLEGHDQRLPGLLATKFGTSTKPKTWTEFAAMMTAAANEFEKTPGIDDAWMRDVLYKNKYKNMQKLGYTSGQKCGETTTSKIQIVEKEDAEPRTTVVQVQAKNGKLLARECEEIGVAWDGKRVTVSVTSDYNKNSSEYNDYTVVDRKSDDDQHGKYPIFSNIVLHGKRKKISPPAGLLDVSASKVTSSGGQATLTLHHGRYNEARATQEFAQTCRMTANVVMYGMKGSSGNGKKSATKVAAPAAPLSTNATTTTFSAAVTLAEKERAAADVSASFNPECVFYDTSPYTLDRVN